jgi:hypothetical protein
MTALDFTQDWQNLSDVEKLSWTLTCNERKEQEARKFEIKNKLQPGSCDHMLSQINPLQRWYEERSRLARKERRNR